MSTFTIVVTPEDTRSPDPVTAAIRRAFPSRPGLWVGLRAMGWCESTDPADPGYDGRIALPPAAVAAIVAQDMGRQVEPFSFALSVPDDVMATAGDSR